MEKLSAPNHALLLLLLSVSLAGLTGCAEEISDANRPAGFTPTSKRSIEHDLLKDFRFAEAHYRLDEVRFSDPEAEQYFLAGWTPFAGAGGESGAWTMDRVAVTAVPRVATDTFTLRLRLQTPAFTKVKMPGVKPPERFEVQVDWNNKQLGTVEVTEEPQFYEMEVAAAVQTPGLNILTLKPSLWIHRGNEMTPGVEGRAKTVGVRCTGLALGPGSSLAAPEVPAATHKADILLQQPDSVVSYYYDLPEGAVLSGRGLFRRSSSTADGTATVTVSLQDRNGTGQTLFRSHYEGNDETLAFRVNEELDEMSGKFAGIHLAFQATPTVRNASPPFTLEWHGLSVTGHQEEVPAENWKAKRRPYNVVMVLFDTLRRDHLPPYGNTEVLAPSIQRLTDEGLTLDGYSVSSWTLPSLVTLLSSTFPETHGQQSNDSVLPDELPWLPSVLHDAGYQTLTVSGNRYHSESYKTNRGFEQYHEIWSEVYKGRSANRTEAIWEQIFDELMSADNLKEPFFLYYHELDPHAPYEPFAPYDTMYTGNYQGNLDSYALNLRQFGKTDLPEADIQYLNALYKGEISAIDGILGHILDRLEELDLRRRTLVVFLSDHGEEFLEHGGVSHQHSLYEEQLQVPFILSLPSVVPEDRQLKEMAQLVDIAPTILDLSGIDIPAGMQGRSLAPYLIAPDTDHPDVFIHAELRKYDNINSVRYGPWKVIRTRNSREYDRPRFPVWHLFNLDEDPLERQNLLSGEFIVAQTLRQALEKHRAEAIEGKIANMRSIPLEERSPELVEELRALGYVN